MWSFDPPYAKLKNTTDKPFLSLYTRLRYSKLRGSTHPRYNKEVSFSVTVIYSPGQFTAFFFVSFPFFRRQNIKNFKKLNFLLIRVCS